MADVAMPRLSDSMEEGTILKWLKSDGDEVKRGEELVEIETDKANMTYEADSDGVLSIVAKEGDTLPVGETIAQLGDGSEGGGVRRGEDADEEPQAEEDTGDAEQEDDADEESGDEEEPEEPAAEDDDEEEEASDNGKPSETPEPAPAEAQESSGDGNGDGRVKASPVAKRMAREMGVELAELEGSGPGGRIVKADVEAAAKGGGTTTAEEEEAPAQEEEAAPGRRGGEEGRPAPGHRGREGRQERPRRRHPPGPHAPAADGRAADGGVEGHRARTS